MRIYKKLSSNLKFTEKTELHLYRLNFSFFLYIFFYRKVALFIGWIIFILLAYKVSKIQLEYVEYDPYAELEVDRVSRFIITCLLEWSNDGI